MKKQLTYIFFLVAVISLAACQNAPTTEPAATLAAAGKLPTGSTDSTATGLYPIDTLNSVLEWRGSKADGSSHTGTIKLQGGELSIFKGNVNGGKMTIDMNSITVTDLAGTDKTDLEAHLKNGDFFEVEKFPTGSFEFGSTMPMTNDPTGAKNVVAGNLTLKGIAKPIRIPFNMRMEAGKVLVETPEFAINRLEWDIQYNSGFIGTVKEKIIDDFVKLKIKLVAQPPVQ